MITKVHTEADEPPQRVEVFQQVQLQPHVVRLLIIIAHGEEMRKTQIPPMASTVMNPIVVLRIMATIAEGQTHVLRLDPALILEEIHREVRSILAAAILEVEVAEEAVVLEAEVVDRHLQDLGHRAETTK